ncbi:MAG: glutaredoxin 3 [Acetobacterales bacterium]
MADIEIYTTSFCPFCHRAKALLDRKGVAYREHDVSAQPELRARMRERAGGRHTVPQIFIDGKGIGGCDDLYALESQGRLDPLLAAGGA